MLKKKMILMFFAFVCVIAIPTNTNASTNTYDVLKDIGFSEYQISKMDYIEKDIYTRIYRKTDGTARLINGNSTHSSLNELLSVSDIDVNIVAGNSPTCQNGYKCAGIYVVGKVDTEKFNLKQIATGAAWSDSWNNMSSKAEVSYGDFWGNTETKSMYLIDATPKKGLAYGYDNLPFHLSTAHTTLEIDLRRTSGDSGTTDVVGKVGFTKEETVLGVSISGNTPGISITPQDKVFQRAATGSFIFKSK
ncbi:hypothetical protein M5X04_08755 [Paenibacillus alvei]|uniref:Lipoprotein n=1 Tax=Paenibacillus alvei TaxID=44250 RepID=A0ABT4E733_PAEAL|nr:hypothetical protein [Paenibacillus alvei]MCY9529420.1 hypothetical protein [Paenibacillus alvei]